MTDAILELIVTKLNTFARNFIQDNPDKADNNYLKQWEPVTIVGMKKFLGLCILMGIVHKPNVNMYWATDDLYWTPVLAKTMSQD